MYHQAPKPLSSYLKNLSYVKIGALLRYSVFSKKKLKQESKISNNIRTAKS